MHAAGTAGATEIIFRGTVRPGTGTSSRFVSVARSGCSSPGLDVAAERVEAALIREITEELGAAATVEGFLGAVEHGYTEDGRTHHEINLVFAVDVDGERLVSQEEHREFLWVPIDDLVDTDLRPGRLKEGVLADLNNPALDQASAWLAWAE